MKYHSCTETVIIISYILGSVQCLIFDVQKSSKVKEYCQAQVFRAKCWRNEVIRITHAKYGRMEIGKCVVADLGYMGCSTDVLHILDAACSGRNQCEYLVPSPDLDNTKPCFQELKTYLEASYQCVKVAMAEKSVCTSRPYLKLVSNQGYLSSYVADTYGCGTLSSPWRVTVFPGQRANISHIDFNHNMIKSKHIRKYHRLGYITDLMTGKNTTIESKHPRQEQMLISCEHSFDIQILSPPNRNAEFLIKYEVYGCQDLIAPEFAWYTREDDAAVVGCEHSDSTWHLRCEGNNWRGVIGNCSGPATTIVIIISMAIGIALCVLACGVVFYLKSQRDKKCLLSKQTILAKPNVDPYKADTNERCCIHQSSDAGFPKSTPGDPGSVKYDYAQVWDEYRVTTGDSDYGSQSYYSSRQQHHMTRWDILSQQST